MIPIYLGVGGRWDYFGAMLKICLLPVFLLQTIPVGAYQDILFIFKYFSPTAGVKYGFTRFCAPAGLKFGVTGLKIG